MSGETESEQTEILERLLRPALDRAFSWAEARLFKFAVRRVIIIHYTTTLNEGIRRSSHRLAR